MRTQIATNVSLSTRAQADELVERRGYSLRDVVTIGIRMLYESEGLKMSFVSDYKPQTQLENDGFEFSHESREAPCPECGAKRWREHFHQGDEYKSFIWSQCLCSTSR